MTSTSTTSVPEDELREKLAAIEHERWSDWQRWLHSKLRPEKVLVPEDMSLVATGNMVISKADYERWERQMDTPYDRLSDQEKASDMEQVDRYWPLVESYGNHRELEGRQMPNIGNTTCPNCENHIEYCELCGSRLEP